MEKFKNHILDFFHYIPLLTWHSHKIEKYVAPLCSNMIEDGVCPNKAVEHGLCYKCLKPAGQ